MNKTEMVIGALVWVIPSLVILQLSTWVANDEKHLMTEPPIEDGVASIIFVTPQSTTAQNNEAPAEGVTIQTPEFSWILQIAAFSNPNLADALEKKLSGAQYPVYQLTKVQNGKPLYLLRMGPFIQRKKAEEMADELKRMLRLNTVIYKVKF